VRGIRNCERLSVRLRVVVGLDGGLAITVMNTDMVDANGCIAVLWSQVAHIGGSDIMLAPLTIDVRI